MAPKMCDQQGLTLDDQKCCDEYGRQAPTVGDQKHGAEDGDQQALTLGDRKCCAEDGRQAPTLDDPKHGAEDGAPTGVNVRRSAARRRRRGITRRRHPTFRNIAPKMENRQAPTPGDQ